MADRLLLDLLEDMVANPCDYSMSLMRRCLGYREDIQEEEYRPDSPVGRFLKAGRRLDTEVLVQESIVPDMTYRFVYRLRYKMERVAVSPKKNTEIIFVGAPGSGKTSVLAGVLDYMYNNCKAFFRCTADDSVLDRSAENCLELIHGLRDHYFPARADQPFVRFNMVDAEKPGRGWTFLDLRGRDILKLTEFQSTRHGLQSIDPSLETENKKTLFFVIDTEAWLLEEKGVVDQQDIFLTKALTVLLNDGPDYTNPTQGCTFSKTRSMAVILTKTDAWRENSPGSMTLDTFLKKRLEEKMSHFSSELLRLCEKYGINKGKEDRLNIITYSAGKRLVGNLLQANPRDAQRLAAFLLED